MALKLITEYKGFTGEYWKINQVTHNRLNGTSSIRLCLYKNLETRQEHVSNFIKTESINIPLSEDKMSIADLYLEIMKPVEQVVELSGELEPETVDVNKFSKSVKC